LAKCAQGDEEAWAVFVESFMSLIRWAIKEKMFKGFIAHNESDIDDVTQQLFIGIWQKNKLKTLKNSRAIRPWLVITAQNAAVDFARRRDQAVRPSDIAIDELPSLKTKDPCADAADNQLMEIVEELLSLLPVREQRIITLELYYDMKHREIANIMGIPLNTISTIIARIKHDLRARLKERGYNV